MASTVSGKRTSKPPVRVSSKPRTRRAVGPTPSAGSDGIVSWTISGAQSIGKDLGAASVAAAKGTMIVAYDVAAAIGQAAKSLVSGTVEAAEAIVRRTGEVATPTPAPPRGRKPLAKARRTAGPRTRKPTTKASAG